MEVCFAKKTTLITVAEGDSSPGRGLAGLGMAWVGDPELGGLGKVPVAPPKRQPHKG